MHAGVLLVDKPGGMTSHDVVSRARRALGTRKIGHAGTLDPMATGLLLLGVEGATRLLTYLVGLDKTYLATIRLGTATTTDDAEGEIVGAVPAERLAEVSDEAIERGVDALRGDIAQVPSSVSAVKVNGRRAYDLARSGERVELAPREVTVSRFEILRTGRSRESIDLDVVVDCSSGTYIRALARDLGADLGVGGHLTALRRTRIGRFDVAEAVPADGIGASALLDPAEVAERAVGRVDVSAAEARDLRHGKRLNGAGDRVPGDVAAAVDPQGRLVGIVQRRGSALKSAMNMPEPPEGAA